MRMSDHFVRAAQAVAAVVALLSFASCRRSAELPPESVQLADALTSAAVDEAVALAGPGGKFVLLGLDLPPEMGDPFSARYKASFRTAAQSRGLVLMAEENLPPNPLMENTGEAVTRDIFLKAIQRHASAALVVFFLPPPKLTAADVAALPATRPKVMVVTTWQGLHVRQLPKGLVQVAIVPKIDPSGGAMDLASQFDVIK